MVVFTCNHCGDSLQKPKVEKHYMTVCRTVKSLTCVDCFKDFKGQDYSVHTKCVTEEERYAAKGSIPNGIVKKGDAKQESWTEMIKSILDKESGMAKNHRNLLETVSQYNNVPRKKQKFMNFIKSSSGGRVNMKEVEVVWNIIEKYKLENSNAAKELKNTNGTDPEQIKNIKNNENSKKRKGDEENDISTKKLKIEVKFSYQDTILNILTKKQTISLSKLQKKVLNRYLKHNGLTEYTDKTVKKFHKNLKKLENIKVEDETVFLQ